MSGGEPGRVLAAFRAHPTAWLLSGSAVLFVLLGTGAVFAGMAAASSRPVAATTPSAHPTTTPPPARPAPTAIAAPSRIRTCSVAAAAADPRLSALSGSVGRPDSGDALWDRAAATPAETGSPL